LRRIAGSLATVSLFIMMTVPAFAAEGASHGSFMSSWGWRIINFSILVFVIVYFGGKHMREYFANRTKKIEGAIENSQNAIEEAKKSLAEIEGRVRNRQSEVDAILCVARENGEREKARLIAEGRKVADEIVKQAEGRIALEVKKAKDAIRTEAASMAVQMAEELLKKNVTADDQKRMVDDYLAGVGGSR